MESLNEEEEVIELTEKRMNPRLIDLIENQCECNEFVDKNKFLSLLVTEFEINLEKSNFKKSFHKLQEEIG